MKIMRSIEITDRNFTDSYSPTPHFADDSFNWLAVLAQGNERGFLLIHVDLLLRIIDGRLPYGGRIKKTRPKTNLIWQTMNFILICVKIMLKLTIN